VVTRVVRQTVLILCCLGLAACQTLTLQPKAPLNAMDVTMTSYSETNLDRYVLVIMTDAAHQELVRGERVDREGELPPLYARFLGNLSRTYGLKRVADWPLNSLSVRCLVFEVADPAQRDATIAALSRERYIESAQRLSLFATSAQAVTTGGYNDPYRNLQPGLEILQVPQSHRLATGRGVRVAVIDTGLDTKHPELKDRVVGIRNFVDRDLDAFNADVHGTAVAGVIAAASNNGLGLVGVAPEASVLGLKACWQSDRAATGALCNTFTLAKALNFAIDQGVDVINLSLGGPQDPLLARLVDKAMEHNTIVVGAASPKWPGGFPAGINGVVAVRNAAESFGSASPVSYLSAPGTQVLSTRPHNEYDFYSGSSFSAAQVAGVSALIRERKPDASGAAVLDLLTTTAAPDDRTANACRALARIVSGTDCGE